MNPLLGKLHPYPFERLRELTRGITPNPAYKPIGLGIGEPKHATPELIKRALTDNLAGLASYPATAGEPKLREACAAWVQRRYGVTLDAATQVLPVIGSREALFSLAQTVIDPTRPGATVVCPNPFYQIYEGAALLANAEPIFINNLPESDFGSDFGSIDEATWRDIQLVYVCSPGNPTGRLLTLDEWKTLFELSDRYGFVIAADECYSEIYFDDADKPIGGLEAAWRLGRTDFRNVVMFSSLSKRSNVPGMRSGFVAGDAKILGDFLLYRTYHGCALNPAVQAASVVAWNDEEHVEENRRLYRDKFARITPMLQPWLPVRLPDAGFYYWVRTPLPDTEFARRLQAEYNVTVLPGSYLARESNGVNPGAGFVRIALVADTHECVEAAGRIIDFCKTL